MEVDVPVKGAKKYNMMQMAKEQAFKQLEEDDVTFTRFCHKMLGTGGGGTGQPTKTFNLDELFGNINELKFCGLMELLSESISCLMSGLTLEEALGRVAKSALKAMSIENLSDLIWRTRNFRCHGYFRLR